VGDRLCSHLERGLSGVRWSIIKRFLCSEVSHIPERKAISQPTDMFYIFWHFLSSPEAGAVCGGMRWRWNGSIRATGRNEEIWAEEKEDAPHPRTVLLRHETSKCRPLCPPSEESADGRRGEWGNKFPPTFSLNLNPTLFSPTTAFSSPALRGGSESSRIGIDLYLQLNYPWVSSWAALHHISIPS